MWKEKLTWSEADGRQLREQREAAHISRRVLAVFVGCSVSAVRSWEEGLRNQSAMARRCVQEELTSPISVVERLTGVPWRPFPRMPYY